ncbi:hypothetical protein MGU_04797 [Metarhizium guizhouense ARSEF 977]|uniref:Uncharacterized protein n=1 Tax=Metarhizium guizhouense (strain ARSEF 977) TaxID=1276136 RepID=A0A0B4GYV7_METGA|nr:hypothetical protein MGU_04797 [Metarhizium guizhouense ARSEF 977]
MSCDGNLWDDEDEFFDPLIANPSTAAEYRDLRIQAFLRDNIQPFPSRFFSGTVEASTRAKAEADGMYTGYMFQEKVDLKGIRERLGLEGTAIAASSTDHLIVGMDDPTAFARERAPTIPENVYVMPTAKSTTRAERAWTGIRCLRRGMRREFRRFRDLTEAATSLHITKLRGAFPSRAQLADRAMLTYRDVLGGARPRTLAEIFAFASLTHVISTLLYRRGCLRRGDILSGFNQWRECIVDDEEKLAFDDLAKKMWPILHRQRNASPIQDDAEDHLQTAAAFAVAGVGILSGEAQAVPISDPVKQHVPAFESIGQGALNLMGLTSDEYDFSQLLDLVGPGNDDSVAQDFDSNQNPSWTTDIVPGCTEPGIFNEPSVYDLADGHPVEPPWPLEDMVDGYNNLHESRNGPPSSLQDTIMFLAVYVFVKENGDYFYILSGHGKTAAGSRGGLAFSSDRSRMERKLRTEFFDPLIEAMDDDVKACAILFIAMDFVILGLLENLEEVQDYVIVVSKVGILFF